MVAGDVVSVPPPAASLAYHPAGTRNPRLCRSLVSLLDWKGLLRCPEFMSVSFNPTLGLAATVILRQSS